MVAWGLDLGREREGRRSKGWLGRGGVWAAAREARRLKPPLGRRVAEATWGGYPGGLVVTKGDPMFPRKT